MPNTATPPVHVIGYAVRSRGNLSLHIEYPSAMRTVERHGGTVVDLVDGSLLTSARRQLEIENGNAARLAGLADERARTISDLRRTIADLRGRLAAPQSNGGGA